MGVQLVKAAAGEAGGATFGGTIKEAAQYCCRVVVYVGLACA